MTACVDHLDALAAAVRQTRAALAGVRLTGPAVTFSPPATPTEPLDPRDQVRAVRVLTELQELVAQLSTVQQHVREELVVARRPRTDSATESDAQYFDTYG